MSELADLSHVSDGQLRAWSDFGVISSARYVDEMVRRGRILSQVADAPSIEPDLDAIVLDADLDLTGFEFLAGVDIADPEVSVPFEARPMFSTVWQIGLGVLAVIVLAAGVALS